MGHSDFLLELGIFEIQCLMDQQLDWSLCTQMICISLSYLLSAFKAFFEPFITDLC